MLRLVIYKLIVEEILYFIWSILSFKSIFGSLGIITVAGSTLFSIAVLIALFENPGNYELSARAAESYLPKFRSNLNLRVLVCLGALASIAIKCSYCCCGSPSSLLKTSLICHGNYDFCKILWTYRLDCRGLGISFLFIGNSCSNVYTHRLFQYLTLWNGWQSSPSLFVAS